MKTKKNLKQILIKFQPWFFLQKFLFSIYIAITFFSKFDQSAIWKAVVFNKICLSKDHIKGVHQGVKDHTCDSCGKAFFRKTHLQTHVKMVHEGVKNHQCHSCGKNFSMLQALRIHVRNVHEGIKDFKCETCGKAFNAAASLQSHIKTVHEG